MRAVIGALQDAGPSLYSRLMDQATSFCNQCGAQNVVTAQFCGRCGVVRTFATAPVAVPAMAAQRIAPVATTRYAGFWIRFVAALIDSSCFKW
jgi:hypothetical protein